MHARGDSLAAIARALDAEGGPDGTWGLSLAPVDGASGRAARLDPRAGSVTEGSAEQAGIYPPYVRTREDRCRWDICLKTAAAMSELCEPSGVADSRYVWFMTRSLYRSDILTGDPGDSPG
jgi:hypothetical protein